MRTLILIWKGLCPFLLVFIAQNGAFAQNEHEQSLTFLKQHQSQLGFNPEDIQETQTKNAYTDHNGLVLVYLQQFYKGLPIEGAIITVAEKEGISTITADRFNRKIPALTKNETQALSPSSLLFSLAKQNGLALSSKQVPEILEGKNAYSWAANFPILSPKEINISLGWYFQKKSKTLIKIFKVNFEDANNVDWWDLIIDANSGELLVKNNWTVSCKANEHHQQKSSVNQTKQKAKSFGPILSNSYQVYDLGTESPAHGPISNVTNPTSRAGSGNLAVSLGWHHTGTNTYFITRGNNVHAYLDANNTNSSSGDEPQGGLSLSFNSIPNFSLPVSNPVNRDAAVTNLFFWNNTLHDIFYQYGFTEAAGNFQKNNQNRGGDENDPILAEAQDGSGTNNANISVPTDGQSPRMQMYNWNATTLSHCFSNTPAFSMDSIYSVESSFSIANQISNTGAITGKVVLVEDSNGTSNEACTSSPISNGIELNNHIALIDRGNCDFIEKVKNAQNAGAIAVIMCNNVSGAPISMGGTDNTITIPAVMISQQNCDSVKLFLMNDSLNITIDGTPVAARDGDFDNGIITHEFGHGISIRLTGGPSTNCLYNEEQMGEGWSDYFALMVNTDWSTATRNTPIGIATYASGQPTNGAGIRTFPYSTDMSINPLIYNDIKTASIPHGIGTVWATMLWEMTWNIIDKNPASPDIYTGNGGNNIALQLVMDAIKLQPCSPGFVDARDALLLADQLNYGGEYNCAIWSAFAKRGLGIDANQGDSNDRSDGITNYNLPSEVYVDVTVDQDEAFEGNNLNYTMTVSCGCQNRIDLEPSALLSSNLNFLSSSAGSLNGNTIDFPMIDLLAETETTYQFSAAIDTSALSPPIVVFLDNMTTNVNWTNTQLGGIGNKNFKHTNTLSNSPSHSWYARDYDSASDFALVSNPFTLVGKNIFSFWHRFQTEEGYDGGFLELTKDGGTTWTDLGPYIINGPYNDYLAAFGQAAYSGTNGSSFSKVEIDLSVFGGETVQIRFRMLTDGFTQSTGINGWYVDDVSMKRLPGETVVASVSHNGIVLNTDNALTQVLECNVPTQIPSAAGTYIATHECSDDQGWTHYWSDEGTSSSNDDLLLLSLKKNGIETGFIGDGVFEVKIVLEPDYATGNAIDLSAAPYVSDPIGWFIMNRWWDVTPNGAGPSGQIIGIVDVKFYFDNQDYDDVWLSIDDNLGIAPSHYSELTFFKVENSDAPASPMTHNGLNMGTDYFEYQTGIPSLSSWAYSLGTHNGLGTNNHTAHFKVSSFSGGGAGAYGLGNNIGLSVEDIQLSAEVENDQVLLSFFAELEFVPDFFIIEKSQDGIHFEKIKEITANGQSSSQHLSRDHHPFIGKSYYKVVAKGQHGASMASDMQVVNYQKKKDLSIYPSPANGNIHAYFYSEKPQMAIYTLLSADGRTITSNEVEFVLGQNPITLEMNELPTGIYRLLIKTQTKLYSESVSFLSPQ